MQSQWITGLVVFALLGAVALESPMATGAQGNGMQYFGGPIMGDPTVYTIFWLPPGQHFEQDATRDTAYEGLINGFIKDLDGSPYFKVAAQYSKDAAGNVIAGGPITGHVTLGGAWVDTAAYSHAGTADDPVLGTDVQTQIQRALAANGWTPALNKVYLVYLAANINYCSTVSGSCTTTGLGGDHYALSGGNTPLLGVGMPDGYSFFPYSFFAQYGLIPVRDGSTPNGDIYADVEVYATAHLLIESVTDPMVGIDGLGAVNPAWNRGDVGSTEVADVCQEYGTAMTVGTHTYILPALYSNAQQNCVFSDPSLSIRLNLTPKIVHARKKETLTVTTGPNAHLIMDLEPAGKVVQAEADQKGTYVYHWTPKHAATTQDIVTAATADGSAGLLQASIKVRKGA